MHLHVRDTRRCYRIRRGCALHASLVHVWSSRGNSKLHKPEQTCVTRLAALPCGILLKSIDSSFRILQPLRTIKPTTVVRPI